MNPIKAWQSAAGGRRRMLAALLALSAATFSPLRLLAAGWNKVGFEARTISDGLMAIGASGLAESGLVELKAPEIAENGAIVPIEVASRIAVETVSGKNEPCGRCVGPAARTGRVLPTAFVCLFEAPAAFGVSESVRADELVHIRHVPRTKPELAGET